MLSKISFWWLPSSIVLLGLAGCAEFDQRKGPAPIIDGTAVQTASSNKYWILNALAEDANVHDGNSDYYYLVTEAGFNYVDDQCRSYFDNLFFLERHREELKSGLAATGATTAAILGITQASAPSLAIVAAAFGLASSATDIVAGTYLYRLPPATTQGFVEKLQLAFRVEAAANRRSINTPTSAYYLIQRYLNLCLPPTIEAEITKQIVSTTAFSVQRGGGPFFSVETASVPPARVSQLAPGHSSTLPSGPTTGPSGPTTGPFPRHHAKAPVIVQPPPPTGFILHPISPFERRGISLSQGIDIQKALCVSPADGDFGGPSSETRKAIAQFKAGFRNIPQSDLKPEDGTIKNGLDFTDLFAAVSLRKGKGTCQVQGFNDAFDVGFSARRKPQ